MAKRIRKAGLPKALQEEEDTPPVQSPEEFAKDMFGEADKPQDGLPSLDWLKGQFGTKSACVRYLVNQGHEVRQIAKHLGMRYQHVRNVSVTELKRGPNEDWRKPLLTQDVPDIKTGGLKKPNPTNPKPVKD